MHSKSSDKRFQNNQHQRLTIKSEEMDKKTLTLTRALTELKTLDRRISNAIGDLGPVTYSVGGKMVLPTTQEDFISKAESQFNSVKDLINYRAALKRAVVLANAQTLVKVNNLTMTIAEAIDYKQIINYKKTLLKRLRTAYAEVTNRVNSVESNNEAKLQQLLNTALGGDKAGAGNKVDDIIKNMSDSFKKANEVKLVDPINVSALIDALDKEITEFDTEIDAVLSETNGKTEITFEF